MNRTNRKGLTLVELMVALSLGLIVFCGTAIIMILGQRSMDRTTVQAVVQRDVSFAMLTMKRSIRSGTKVDIDDNGGGFTIYYDSGSVRYWFDSKNKNMLYQFDGQNQKTLLAGTVKNATFEVTDQSVTIGITLEKDSCSARLLSTTTLRNYKSQI